MEPYWNITTSPTICLVLCAIRPWWWGALGTQLPCWQLQKGSRLEKVNTLTSFLLHKAEGDLPSYDIHSVLSAGLPAN